MRANAYPVALTAREHAQALENVIFGKQECSQQAAQLGLRVRGRQVPQVIQHAGLGIQLFILVLREVIGFHVVPQAKLAPGHRLNARQQLDERGFARAIHSHQRHTVATLNHETDGAKHPIFAVALGHLLKLRHHAPAGLGLGKREVDGLLLWRNLDALYALQFLDATLHLLGLGGLVAEAIDKRLNLLDAVALVAIGGLQLLLALSLLL